MKKNKKIFILSMPIIMAVCSLFVICDIANAAPRTAVRSAPISRKSVATIQTTTNSTESADQENEIQTVEQPVNEEINEDTEKPIIIENKSRQFDEAVSAVMENASKDNGFAELILKQRAAIAASEASATFSAEQKKAMSSNSSTCDIALRKCMRETCGNDFTKCALDGDSIFGDKLNRCKRDTDCTGEEFNLFSTEIKADRDMNVRLSSYNNVIDCGNSYNACIVNECGTTYGKCLGKTAADSAIQKCATIAKECTESDSGLVSRFGTAIGKLRENAEVDIKKDEEHLYALRDSMSKQCKMLGAMFDERSFDCVFSVEFFAGENQSNPTATRQRYAGDTFVCMQEWFGINATTFKENAYRETRAQKAASSAMLGSGVGTAVGTLTSGALGRALDTQKAGEALENNDDASTQEDRKAARQQKRETRKANKGGGEKLKGMVCTDAKEHHLLATYDENGDCKIKSCVAGYTLSNNGTSCVKNENEKQKQEKQKKEKGEKSKVDFKAHTKDYNTAGKTGSEKISDSVINNLKKQKQSIKNATSLLPDTTQRAIGAKK